jgi:hypothetical protein
MAALATSAKNGYVRESAVKVLAGIRTGTELPFLLLRLNDWVHAVQQRAATAVRGRIEADYAVHFARQLELLYKLEGARRNSLVEILSSVRALLSSPAGRPALEAQFGARARTLRQAALRLATETYEGHERWAVIERALTDCDLGIRMWAAQIACAAGRALPRLQRDPSGIIRVWALRARAEREPIIDDLRAALLDRAVGVRAGEGG